MSKEYTYDIDKYTIGVDENGEDGIGLTVAKIKNGEINFLGNCYGENARCLDLLIKENQELKSQLKGTTHCFDEEEHEKLKKQLEEKEEELELVRCDLHNRTSERNGRERELDECLFQQKEFINYLNSYIDLLNDKPDMLEETQKDILEETLQKYKSIIGVSDDKTN